MKLSNKYVYRYWDRDDPQDGRAYLDIWTTGGEAVGQKLIPKGFEDAMYELVITHFEKYRDRYYDPRAKK